MLLGIDRPRWGSILSTRSESARWHELQTWSTFPKLAIVVAIVLIAIVVAVIVGGSHAGRAAVLSGGALLAILGNMIWVRGSRGRGTSRARRPPES